MAKQRLPGQLVLNKKIAYSKTINKIIKPSGAASIKLVVEKLF